MDGKMKPTWMCLRRLQNDKSMFSVREVWSRTVDTIWEQLFRHQFHTLE